MKYARLLTVFKQTVAAPSDLPQCNACYMKPDALKCQYILFELAVFYLIERFLLCA